VISVTDSYGHILDFPRPNENLKWNNFNTKIIDFGLTKLNTEAGGGGTYTGESNWSRKELDLNLFQSLQENAGTGPQLGHN
jgi:hypothetical protein